MPAMFLNQATRGTFRSRIEAIAPDSKRLWGKMEPAQMLSHLTRALELSLGEIPVEDQSNILTRTLMRWLVFHTLPWPKGKVKAPPIFFPPTHGDVAVEKGRLFEALERFVSTAAKEPERQVLSPIFGRLPLRYWERINGMHLDHHLRQFGV